MIETYDVAVVGLGPVGATLANLLGLLNVKTLVLEREPTSYHLPRAVHFDDEVMRVFQMIGLAEPIIAKTRVSVGMRFVDPDGRLLLDWPRSQEIGPQGWHASYRFHQPDLEASLRSGLGRFPHVTVLSRAETFMVEDKDSHVVLRYEDLARGEVRRVRADYVVGCDGARSTIRRFIEARMEDLGFHERWLVVDVLLNRPKPELGDHSIQFCDPRRPATYVRGPENRRRWEIAVLPDEDATDIVSPKRVWQLLGRWLTPGEAEIERAAIYTFHSLVAEIWAKGRLLLAGDAAHQTPPFMGQGMCAGIRDVANLAWKLREALDSDAPRILRTYETERRPNAREYVATAARLGELINASRTEAALKSALRQSDGSALMESIAPPLGPGLGERPSAGRLFGQPRLSDGRLMDEAIGYSVVLVGEAALIDAVDLPAGLAIVTTEDAPDADMHLARVGCRAALLRPDRYILATADDAEGLARICAEYSTHKKTHLEITQ